MMRYIGVILLFSGETIGTGIVFVAAGIGMHFLAEHVNESKEERIRNTRR